MDRPFADTLGAEYPAEQDRAGGMLRLLSGLKPQDPAAVNPATTAAMAQSRDAVTKLLQKQLSKLDSPFAGLSDVATAAQAALATRGHSMPAVTYEGLQQDRISKATQIANTLSQVANREASVGSKSAMTPYQQAQVLLNGMKYAAGRGDKDAAAANKFYDQIASKMEPDSAMKFMVDWHNTVDELERRTGRKFNGDQMADIGRNMLSSAGGQYEAKKTGNFMSMDLTGQWWAGNKNKAEVAPVQPGARPSNNVPKTQWDMTFDQASRETGLPSTLLKALAASESNFDPAAVSPKGARGLTQLMPGTAAELGVDPSNPDQNIIGGSRYLKQQMDRYGNLDLALMAYNWGPANVDKWLQSNGQMRIPDETAAYVTRVKARMMAYDRPAQAGGAPQQVAQAMPQGGQAVPNGISMSERSRLASELFKQQKQANVFNELADSTIQDVQRVGARGFGPLGWLAQIGGATIEQAQGAIRSSQPEVSGQAGELISLINKGSPFLDRVVGMGADAAGIKAGIITLAYAYARANNEKGTLSNQDFEIALQTLSAGTGSPQQFIAAVNQLKRSMGVKLGGDAGARPMGGGAIKPPEPGKVEVDEASGMAYQFMGGDPSNKANWKLLK